MTLRCRPYNHCRTRWPKQQQFHLERTANLRQPSSHWTFHLQINSSNLFFWVSENIRWANSQCCWSLKQAEARSHHPKKDPKTQRFQRLRRSGDSLLSPFFWVEHRVHMRSHCQSLRALSSAPGRSGSLLAFGGAAYKPQYKQTAPKTEPSIKSQSAEHKTKALYIWKFSSIWSLKNVWWNL